MVGFKLKGLGSFILLALSAVGIYVAIMLNQVNKITPVLHEGDKTAVYSYSDYDKITSATTGAMFYIGFTVAILILYSAGILTL